MRLRRLSCNECRVVDSLCKSVAAAVWATHIRGGRASRDAQDKPALSLAKRNAIAVLIANRAWQCDFKLLRSCAQPLRHCLASEVLVNSCNRSCAQAEDSERSSREQADHRARCHCEGRPWRCNIIGSRRHEELPFADVVMPAYLLTVILQRPFRVLLMTARRFVVPAAEREKVAIAQLIANGYQFGRIGSKESV